MDSFAWAYPSATSSHVPSSSTPSMSIDDPFKDHSTSSTTATQGQATGTTSNSNPSSSSLDLSAFTFDDMTGSNSSSTSSMLSPSNPYIHPFANYFVGYPYSTWPVSSSNVPLSSYSTLNGATTVGPSSSGSSVPQQAQSSQSQPPASSASQSQSHGQGQQQQQHSPSLQHASPMIVDSQAMNGGSGSSGLAAHAFQPNNYSTSNTQYYALSANPYTSPYYRQPSSHGGSSSSQTQGQGTLSPHALHSSAASPPNSSPSSYMFSPTTGMHPAMFYGVPQSQPGPTAVPVSASSSSSSTPSAVSTQSTVTTPQLQHPHPSQQQFQQQYHQFQLQQQQQQQQFQQQLQQQQQQQEAAAREAAAREKERERREKFEKSVRPLLQSNAFTGAGAVRDLVDKIDEFGIDKVDPALRLEILQKMRDGAPNHYFRAWSENPDAMEVTREWLKKAAVMKDGEIVSKEVSETVMPLLHILDRLPLTLDILKTSKIGRIVRNLVKQSPSPAIKDMASNLERRWLELVQKAKVSDSSGAANSGSTPNQSSGTEVSKKRKEPPSASSASASNSKASAASGNGAPPSKKPAVGTSTSTKPSVKKESSSKTSSSSSASAASAKGAGTDTSFFSAPKPKVAKSKLPSFKKAPIPQPTKPSTPNADSGDDVALPSAADPFAEIVKAMKLKREPLSSNSPANVPGSTATGSKVGGTASGKIGKRKSVTWASGDALVSVKLIERAVYDDDMKDGIHTSLRDLDRGEGAALHQQGLEEAIDWSEPQALLLTEDTDHPRGGKSEEKEVQEAREATALGALYMNESQIPDTPAEPSQVMPEEEVDKNAVVMTLGPDNEDLTWNAEMMAGGDAASGQGLMAVDPLAAAAALQAQPAVAQLLQQLGAIDPAVLSSLPLPAAQGEPFGGSAGPTLQHLIQQLQSTTPGAAPGYEQGQQPSGGWQGGEYDQGDYSGSAGGPGGWGDNAGGRRGRGRGGRGSGGRGGGGGARSASDGFRSNRRIPCTFFAEGRCKFGDHCNFSHATGQAF